ncbi:NADH-quinone oxidoreductase subunit NuoF [candidate division BRC1 bacterium HGW-BRC1-1]|jgi:NADH-quinone oxidoreductase subunit F|nr:MAG: NADH-quinone oxidoreductase subunit NuoF [candidate division BRC1 bacterium HGW-BRC1-1]
MAQVKVLTKNIDLANVGAPCDYQRYMDNGGYEGAKAAFAKQPQEVQQIVKDSNLRGRGGAGFPTGLKWSFVPMNFTGQKYLVCNCDEMEPGTFKDRALLYGDPHQLIEGMLIAAYAMQMTVGYIFIRWEYRKGAALVDAALEEARKNGWLGKNIQGSGFDFHLETHLSAGRYICGEETALLNSLEGLRANPRSKPPFPQIKGFLGQPTIVNNVETFGNLPHILAHGAEWYKKMGTETSAGTKIMGASGRVKNPRLWELPLGVSLRELIYDYAGGPARSGQDIKAVIPGGLSTPLLVPDEFDTLMDFDSVAKAGSRLGTACIIVFDQGDNMVEATENIMRFYRRESCGFCTPCREGIPWIWNMVNAITQREGKEGDMELMAEAGRWLSHTFCAFAPGAQGPFLSALEKFRGEFEEFIRARGAA